MSRRLSGKTIVVGITGSIAAYKGVEVARRLMDLGADVHATLTRAGEKFITPLTLRTLTGNQVTCDMFDEPQEWEVRHVSLAERAAAVLVAPATADAIAKLALGIADEFIYTVALATRAPLLVAPAMSDKMYRHPMVQENLARLRARGAHVIEPEVGRLASGAIGVGRLAEPEAIAAAVAGLICGGDLEGTKLLVTAGPTREPLDPVRFISNRSSGRMGYALAEAASRRGGSVAVVSGPTSVAPPAGCEMVSVETTADMYEAVVSRFAECDVLIAAAAPADYAPASASAQKLKKTADPLSVRLDPTPDIVAECGRRKQPGQFLVGFAAETENLLANAQEKLRAKNLDLVVANEISDSGVGIDSDRNAGYLVFPEGEPLELRVMTKGEFADRVLDAIVARWGRAASQQ